MNTDIALPTAQPGIGCTNTSTPHAALPPFPELLYVEPTNACNCTCTICPRHQMCRPVGLLEMRLFRDIVRQAAALGCKELRLFNFGEPLLHPDIADIVSITVKAGLMATLQTNGVLLDEAIMNRLFRAGLRYIGISTNGLTDEEYAMVRPGFTLPDLRDRIRRTRAAAQAARIPLYIHLCAHVHADSAEERLPDIQRFVNSWQGIPNSIAISGISRYENIAYPRNGHLVRRTDDPTPLRPDSEVACNEPFNRMIIKWDGRVTPCCADFDAEYVLGDATTTPLDVIWRSAPLQQLQSIVRARAYDNNPLCRKCPKRTTREFSLVWQREKHHPA